MIPVEYIIGAGALVGITLYIIFGGDEPFSFSNGYMSTASPLSAAGLMNLGQTCFFNAVLQALASCQTFCDWMAAESTANGKHCHKKLCDLLHGIFNNLKSCRGDAVADTRVLARLLDEIRRHGWVVENSEQHDAHELFQAIMNLLHSTSENESDVLESIASSSVPELQDQYKLSSGRRTIHKCKIEQPIWKALKTPMLGYIASGMTCKTCLRKSAIKYAEFTSLSLNFPPATHNRSFQLEELLSYFFLSENVTEVDCMNCSRRCGATVKRNFVKEQSLGKMPQCLCLHVQRLGWYGYHAALKRHDSVTFPAMLELTRYTQLYKMLGGFSHNRAIVTPKADSKDIIHTTSNDTHTDDTDITPADAITPELVNSTSMDYLSFPVDAALKVTSSEDSDVVEGTGNDPTHTMGIHEYSTESQANGDTANQGQAKACKPNTFSSGDSNSGAVGSLPTSRNSQDSVPQLTCRFKPPSARSWYSLVSVIEHRGSEVSGHFVTYRKMDRGSGRWIYTSDLDIAEVTAEYVHSRPPYMLFYERMSA